jgi:hypothetical protein
MKSRLLSKATLALSVAVVMAASTVAFAIQDPAPKPQEEVVMMKKKAPRKKRTPAGIPKGPQACVDRLIQIASAEPFPAYGRQAAQIVNNGLLWDNPKSKCSVGSDQALRTKVSTMVTAWNEKNAEKTRSLLQEIKAAVPAG